MDEVWQAFEEVNSMYNNAYVAYNEDSRVYCSFGEDIPTAFRKMADLLDQEKPLRILAMNGDFTDDNIFAITVIGSKTDLAKLMDEDFNGRTQE